MWFGHRNESTLQIEGFKLHVTHNTKPFVNRIRYVPEVAGRPDRIEKDLANARILASILEEEAAFLRTYSPFASADDMDTNGDAHPGDVAAGESNEDDAQPKEVGSQAVERRIEKILADLREQGVEEKSIEAKRVRSSPRPRIPACSHRVQPVISLDLYLAYLRAAYHTCYYCAVVTDHSEELQRKCLKHVRKPLSKSMLEEVKAAEADKAEKEKKEDEKETDVAITKPPENRDWKRNGMCGSEPSKLHASRLR